MDQLIFEYTNEYIKINSNKSLTVFDTVISNILSIHGSSLLSQSMIGELHENLNVNVKFLNILLAEKSIKQMLSSILQTKRNKVYLRSIKKNNVYLDSYEKNTLETDENNIIPPVDTSWYKNGTVLFLDIIINENETLANQHEEIWTFYRIYECNPRIMKISY